jgi:hypothetical protein
LLNSINQQTNLNAIKYSPSSEFFCTLHFSPGAAIGGISGIAKLIKGKLRESPVNSFSSYLNFECDFFHNFQTTTFPLPILPFFHNFVCFTLELCGDCTAPSLPHFLCQWKAIIAAGDERTTRFKGGCEKGRTEIYPWILIGNQK